MALGLGGAGTAAASNTGKPRVPPSFLGPGCIETIDRAVDPSWSFDLGIPFEDTALTEDEPPDGRTFQFFALCRQPGPLELLPPWVSAADAVAAAMLDPTIELPAPGEPLDERPEWLRGGDHQRDAAHADLLRGHHGGRGLGRELGARRGLLGVGLHLRARAEPVDPARRRAADHRRRRGLGRARGLDRMAAHPGDRRPRRGASARCPMPAGWARARLRCPRASSAEAAATRGAAAGSTSRGAEPTATTRAAPGPGRPARARPGRRARPTAAAAVVPRGGRPGRGR